MKITSSKNLEKVRRWAKKNNRGILWQDENDVWHAATTNAHVPENSKVLSSGCEGEELAHPPNNHIGKQLAWLRENAGLTQAEIAKRMSK